MVQSYISCTEQKEKEKQIIYYPTIVRRKVGIALLKLVDSNNLHCF